MTEPETGRRKALRLASQKYTTFCATQQRGLEDTEADIRAVMPEGPAREEALSVVRLIAENAVGMARLEFRKNVQAILLDRHPEAGAQ